MKFEEFDQAYEAEDQLLPDGENEVEIVRVKEWSSRTDDRKALIVTLRPIDAAFVDVEKWLDPTRKEDHRAAMQLADSVGIDRDEDLGENLVGRRVIAKTKQAKNRKGETVVYVNRFSPAGPAADPAPAAKPAARTPKQKVEAAGQGGSSDDLPF